MANFEIGAIYWPRRGLVNIEVLQTGYPELQEGSSDLVSTLLSACNLDGNPGAWSLQPSRSYFFSGFPESEDWEDRWCKGWTVSVELNRMSEGASTIFAPAMPIDVSEPKSGDTDRVREGNREKFTLISKAEKLSDRDLALATEGFIAQTNPHLENFKIAAVFPFKGRLFLKLVFPSFDEAEEKQILGFISKLERRGYLTHWQDLLP